jgi:muramoyltetrapeptide carboxypeptidase LdcA involved in peptidoglycan recycling
MYKRIAICSFSGYASFPGRFERGVKELNRIFQKVVIDGIQNDSVEGRLECFYKALNSPDIDAIISLTGGYNSNELIDKIDYAYVKKHQKPIIGYSDTTALMLALYSKIGMVSFYGPSVLADFGAYGGLHAFTEFSLMQAMTAKESYRIAFPPEVSYSNDFWDRDDIIPLRYEKNNCCFSRLSKNDNIAEGVLLGGNLNTILAMLGTPYLPSMEGAILFLEDSGSCPKRLRRDLNTLKQAGVFKKVSGLLFAKFLTDGDSSKEQKDYRTVIEDFFSEYSIPLFFQMDFGHHVPRITMPIGKYAKINSAESSIEILIKADNKVIGDKSI